jgi:thiol-disulfide isomerase/thioredoxin
MLTNGGFMDISKKFFRLFFGLYLISTFNLQTHYVEAVELVDEIALIDDFYKALSSKKPTIIKLYSKNCPHCKMFEEPFKETARKYRNINFLSADGKKLNAAQVVKEVTNGKIQIPGYPTILYIKNGAIVDMLIGGDPKKHTEKVKNLIKK